ncbi:Methyltransferase-like protein 10 [Kappamyces sp. JEL0829]|nr:Methyltransferase-like protein 10 [Kappamyces sp. JEL0829]KAJ3337592.1 Methyltransferase-like protein 10 [Kappamyces sp. JEL0680]
MTLEELNSSKLGTLEYWDDIYDRELGNFNSFKDKGEVWFGEDAAERMIDWCDEHVERTAKIGDLGCGNGHLVFGLHELQFTSLLGCDYSQRSIDLCRAISAGEGISADSIAWAVLDILDPQQVQPLVQDTAFDVLLDKGTFDAISLAKIDSDSQCTPANQYVGAVKDMLRPGGLLLLTSCNWTEPELLARFAEFFAFKDRIKYPTFKFGGVEGSTIVTVALERK